MRFTYKRHTVVLLAEGTDSLIVSRVLACELVARDYEAVSEYPSIHPILTSQHYKSFLLELLMKFFQFFDWWESQCNPRNNRTSTYTEE